MKTITQAAEKKQRKFSRAGAFFWAIRKLYGIEKRFVFYIFADIPFMVLTPLLTAYFPKALIDALGSGADMPRLAQTAILYCAAIAGMNILHRLVTDFCNAGHYYPTMVYDSEMRAHEDIGMDYETVQNDQEFKTLSQHVWSDATRGNCSLEFFWVDISKFLGSLVGISAYGAMIGMLDPVLLGVVAATCALSYATTRWQPVYRRRHRDRFEKEQRRANYLEGLSEDFSSAKDIKLYGMAPWLERLNQNYRAYVLLWEKKCGRRGLWARIFAGILALAQDGTAYLVLLGAFLAGDMGAGDFVFYFGLVGSIAGFFGEIIRRTARLSTRAEKIQDYRDFFAYPNRMNHGPGAPLPTAPVKIELRHVWYRYAGAGDWTLRDVNLTIQPGESIALVGQNGAGKTTLIKLICGMYRPTKGEVLVGGKKIEAYNIEEYFTLISAVFQEVEAVAFTMFEYVAGCDLGRKTAREDAETAMKKAGIWEKIRALPHGMDTHLMKGIYDDGVDLSGGEMQKLVLARAIYKDGPIFILDEPTAALDPIAENQIYLQYRQLTRGKTSVYISHRFASTRFCDRIVLLEKGQITETGTHDGLMARNGSYACMFGVQAKYYREGRQHV